MRTFKTSLLVGLLTLFASPLVLMAQDAQGRGALRPYVHIFLAYGAVWLLVGFWVWRIASRLGALEKALANGDD